MKRIIRCRPTGVRWLAATVFSALFLVSLSHGEPVTLSGRAMGTTWVVKYVPAETSIATNDVARRVGDRLEELEQQFSTYRLRSEVSRFNAQPERTGWVAVSPELAAVTHTAREISAHSAGAFDVTVEPLVRLWGFGGGDAPSDLPDKERIRALQSLVNWRDLEVRQDEPALRRVKPGSRADFSSVAKGFAADVVGALLASCGLPNHFVQVGGDIKTAGHGSDGQRWRVGIERPGTGEIARVVELTGEAVSTSGNYRNFVRIAGREFGHIIDPRTGSPVDNDLLAVAVVHGSCAESSGWATALFVLGSEAGGVVAEREGIAALFFVCSGASPILRATTAFARISERPLAIASQR